jgi:hypothetical protein
MSKYIGFLYVGLFLCPIILIFTFRHTQFVSDNMIYLIGVSYFFGIPVIGAALMGFSKEAEEDDDSSSES